MSALVVSFGVIFVAELGDKSQLMALAFAARYRPLAILAAITVATAVVHALSVGIGVGFGAALPTDVLNIAAGVAFFGFAAWTIRGDDLDEADRAQVGRGGRSAFVAVGTAFFLAELGDKTMLATVTLATTDNALGVWAGSTVGMVAADALAIALGARLAQRLSQRTVRLVAAASFVAFGAVLVIEGLR